MRVRFKKKEGGSRGGALPKLLTFVGRLQAWLKGGLKRGLKGGLRGGGLRGGVLKGRA